MTVSNPVPRGMFPHYQSTLASLSKIEKPGIHLDLAPMRALMSKLGCPWRAFPSILVAGTNGKGSTAAMIAEVLVQAGYKVGIYTSPHLCSYRERITVQKLGEEASFHEQSWCDNFFGLWQIIKNEDKAFTRFEILTALAFLIFKEEKVDIAVLETGLGGRLDATNVVEPILSVITTIDYDHQEYLGHDLSSIAGEKGGIFRRGAGGVTIQQSDEVLSRLQAESAKLGVTLQVVVPGKLESLSLDGQSFAYAGKIYEQGLLGLHQVSNACLAIEACKRLQGFRITDESIHAGVKSAVWPGRCEVLSSSPSIILDGAHNPGGCEALLSTLSQLKLAKPCILILGILADKDAKQMLEVLSPWGEEWILTRPLSPRAMQPSQLMQFAQSLGLKKVFHVTDKVSDACRLGLSLVQDGTLVIAGSLFTVGEARRIFLQSRRGLVRI